MSLKAILPWLCTAGALAGVGGLYVSNSKLDSELALARSENQELQQYKAASETNGLQAQAASDELARLRKDNEDLLRLRNEARQLRSEKQQLATQLQTLQGQVQSMQAQAQGRVWSAQSGTVATFSPDGSRIQPVKPTPGVVPGVLTGEQVAINACINNLRQIDAAKQQWALENNKPANTLVSAVNITPYLPGNVLPTCPGGGTYTINAIGVSPACSVAGHQLGK